MLILLTGTQHRRRKIRMMDRIRIELGFQTESVTRAIHCTILSGVSFSYEIGSIEVDTGQCGLHTHGDAG